jgi:CHAD domain-containing protein
MALDTNRIEESLRRVRKTIKKLPAHPTPSEIHRLRTRVRRCEAMLRAFGIEEPRLLEYLARIRKRAGKVRDMDVLTSQLSKVRVDGEQDCLIQLYEYLGTKRYRNAGRVHRLAKKYRNAVDKRLKRVARVFAERADEGSVMEEATTAALRCSAELGTQRNLNRGNLHTYRLKLKELRFILQMGDEARYEEFVEALGENKDAIGEWHDWEELKAIAAKILDHTTGCQLRRELNEIAQQKYESALSSANKLQKTYFRPPSRAKSRARIKPDKLTRAFSEVSALNA